MNTAPPSLALARMAWDLAQRRAFPFTRPQPLEAFQPMTREYAHFDDVFFVCSTEYYAICDRIAQGETP